MPAGRKKQDLGKKKPTKPPVTNKERKITKFTAPRNVGIQFSSEIATPLTPEMREGLNKYKCISCGAVTDNPDELFHTGYSNIYIGWSYHFPMCKNCMDNLYDAYARVLTYEEVYRRMCMTFDIYFDENLAQKASQGSKPNRRMTGYINRTKLNQYANKTYADTVNEELEEKLKKEQEEAEKTANTPVLSIEEVGATQQTVSKESFNFWGFGFTVEEYQFLDNKFVEWTISHECKNKAQESYFQKICMIELLILKANQKGEDASKLYDQFNKLMNSANLQPRQTNENALADTNTVGTLIKKWEDNAPIPKPKPEWEDVDGIRKYISVWFLGHLCKLIGIDNKFSQQWTDLCENEVNKYTVTPPNYEDEEGSAATFEDVFGQ